VPRPVKNPPNPWAKTEVEWLDEPPNATLQVFEEEARSILSENESPDLPFRYSLNPYRGCLHACAYCYARPSHQYLGFGAGTDFDRKIVVKTNAPDLLREAFERPGWRGDGVVLSGNTDCYQGLEASYELTRRCLAVCLDFQNPVSIITKSRLVARDAALLGEIARRARAFVFLSIPFARDEDAQKIEPWASKPSLRFEAMRLLAEAGVPVGLGIAPVIPGLNDSDIAELLERGKEAGARVAFMQPLRLSAEVLPVFEERLAEAYPDRAQKVRNAILEMRGGKMNDSQFGSRFAGKGPRWAMIERVFETHCKRLGLSEERLTTEGASTFRRPKRQLSLFEG
jgi:DNA repair photolyase